MPTQKDIENLQKVFLSSRDILLDKIINTGGAGTKTYYNTVLKQLEKELERLQKETNTFIDIAVPAEYKQGLDDVYSYFQRNNLMMKQPNIFANIHTDAVYGLAREMQYQISEGMAQAGRQVLRYLDTSRDETLRKLGLEATAEKTLSGSTVLDMRNNLINKLQNEGFMTVQYGQGRNAYQVSLDSYASMVARSTTREAGNLARENQLTENGYDLVQITEHYPTCNLCAQFQGRVFSISGKDKRFPPLSRAFASGYRNIHPNCRHSIVPWIESLHTEEEIQQAVKQSNVPFEDNRDQKQIDLYNKQQAQNRQMRQDLYQYERYKTRLGEDAPKSFHAFRKVKNAGGDKWDNLQKKYKNWLYNQDYSDIIHLRGKLSNYQSRRWYKTHDENIPSLIDKSLPLEQQARQAHALRNQYRTEARELMADQEERKYLDEKYPNSTFEELLERKKLKYGLTDDAAYEDIIRSSQTTNKRFDKESGIDDKEGD